MGPRLRGDDSGESLLHIFASRDEPYWYNCSADLNSSRSWIVEVDPVSESPLRGAPAHSDCHRPERVAGRQRAAASNALPIANASAALRPDTRPANQGYIDRRPSADYRSSAACIQRSANVLT